MKFILRNLSLIMGFGIMLAACGGGGENGGTITEAEFCDGDGCISFSESAIGNYVVGIYTGDGATDAIKYDVDEEVMVLSCDDNATSEGTYIYFSCNYTSGGLIGADCFHGEVSFFDGSNPYNDYFSTGCQSITVFCDSYGIDVASTCNDDSSKLIKRGLVGDQSTPASLEIDESQNNNDEDTNQVLDAEE